MSEVRWADRPVLVVGAGGMLGSDLVPHLREKSSESGEAQIVALSRKELDVTSAPAIDGLMGQVSPGVVINCAAFTNVDGCESHVEQAMSVNAEAPGLLGDACRLVDALLVHIGTDFIFDGVHRRPYREDDAANPLSVYGKSKWEGEQAIRASECRHLIVRTSWLFGIHGKNFVEAILNKAMAGEELRVVDDQVGRPTHTVDLCEAIVELLDAGAEGIVHFANEGQCSWHEFATEIVERSGCRVEVRRISSDQLDRPARRPSYSVLDLTRYHECSGRRARPWSEVLREYLDRREQARAAKRAETKK